MRLKVPYRVFAFWCSYYYKYNLHFIKKQPVRRTFLFALFLYILILATRGRLFNALCEFNQNECLHKQLIISPYFHFDKGMCHFFYTIYVVLQMVYMVGVAFHSFHLGKHAFPRTLRLLSTPFPTQLASCQLQF